MDYEKIGIFIANRRKELNMTQKDLAIKLNLTDKAISKWERGLGCPDISLLGELSTILDVGIGEILNGEYDEKIKDNNEFVKTAINCSKEIIKENLYKKIRIISYTIITMIVIYVSFLGINQFIYLKGGVYHFAAVHNVKDYEKLKLNLKQAKNMGLLDNLPEYITVQHIIELFDNTNLLKDERVFINNTDFLNISKNLEDLYLILNKMSYELLIPYEYSQISNFSDFTLSSNFDTYIVIDNIKYQRDLYDYSMLNKEKNVYINRYSNFAISLLHDYNELLQILIEKGEINE